MKNIRWHLASALIGLIIASIAIGCLTNAAYGFLALGVGIIVGAVAHYVNHDLNE